MDISELIKIFMSNKPSKPEEIKTIPSEISNQYPYGEFPIRYTKLGQEYIRKNSENRYSRNEENYKDNNDSKNESFDIMSILPFISLMSNNKKQPKEMFELLSSVLFKDKPELKKLLNLMPKPKNQEITNNEAFPDTNKISISSLKKINSN